MNESQYLLACWHENEREWWAQEQGNVYRSETGRRVYKGALKVESIQHASSFDDAKTKWALGTTKFSYLNKGKCIFDKGLTAGDHTAIRRCSGMILRQLSDEAIEFLLTVGGVTPANSPDARIQQLRSKIIGAA
jgi:hypothetical protein